MAVFAILLSCLLGVLMSLTIFLIDNQIGATSSLSYNVIGHLETVSNLLSGYLIFGDKFSAVQLGGMGLALVAIGWFAQVRHHPLPVPCCP